jgi:hypothetical protein
MLRIPRDGIHVLDPGGNGPPAIHSAALQCVAGVRRSRQRGQPVLALLASERGQIPTSQ